MDFQHVNTRRRNAAGFTLAEFMVSLAIAGLLGAALAGLSFYFSRSSSVVMNYAAINAKDRASLEILGRDIREATNFLAMSQTSITLQVNGQNVQLLFNQQEGCLYRSVGVTKQVLLPDVDMLLFEFRQRNPAGSTFENHLVSTSAVCRIIEMTWSSTIASDHRTGQQSTVVNTAKYLNRRLL